MVRVVAVERGAMSWKRGGSTDLKEVTPAPFQDLDKSMLLYGLNVDIFAVPEILAVNVSRVAENSISII